MRELHAVYISGPSFAKLNLKATSILFDKLHVVGLNSHIEALRRDENRRELFGEAHLPDCEYLVDQGFLGPMVLADKYYRYISAFDEKVDITREQAAEFLKGPEAVKKLGLSWDVEVLMAKQGAEIIRRQGLLIRFAACQIEASGNQAVPIGGFSLRGLDKIVQSENYQVIHIASRMFPAPDEGCAREDVFNFKAEMADKFWNFRRFLRVLGTKKQTEAETKDDLEWTLNEYTKAMKIHHLKAGESFMEVYVIPVMELVEDLGKFNWSKIAKGALSVKKRQVELMEAEMKAPGRECAYVFEAQKRFGADH
jgi:hypothetical protein